MADFYDDDCTPPVRVYVGGDEIPVINKGVETQARTDGPMDINKVSDVYFPAEWQGVDIIDKIEAFNPDEGAESVWEPVDIKFLNPKSGEYVTYHRGFPIGYGAGSKGTLERKLRVGDPGMLLNNTPFTGSYKYDATINDILTDLFSEFESHQDVFDVVEVANIDQVLDPDMAERMDGGFMDNDGDTLVGDILEPITAPIADGIGDLLGTTTEKSFKSNEHTLQDVINYVTNKVDGELYFSPLGHDPNQIALVYDQNRTIAWYPEHMTQMSGGKVPRVIKNNALYEIQPINTVEVNGETDRGVFDTIEDIIASGTKEYPTAKARHTDLHRLAGQEYQPPVKSTDATTISEAEDEARERLIKKIEGGGMGEMCLYLFPHINPHDTIVSQPACGENIASDVQAIDYSVEEVTQRVGYEDDTDHMKMRTHLRVNTHITSDDIEIVESSMEEL